MGKNNKQRRAEKARKDRARKDRARNDGARKEKAKRRAREQGPSRRGGGGSRAGGWAGFGSEQERVEALYGANQLSRASQDGAGIEATVAELARCAPAMVAREIERDLARILPALWAGGWLPGELIRQVRRTTSANGERLISFAVAVDHHRRPPSSLHPRWRLHVESLELPVDAPADGWLRSRALSQCFTTAKEWPEVIELASSIAFELCGLARLGEIIPPPGEHHREQTIVDLSAQFASPMLSKVRQLLAQAESTSFDAEAEAFTAKAQELMARHAIDAALVWDRQERAETPTTIRVALDDPYVDAKSLLISVVAEASQCRAVFHPSYALSSVVGFESDLIWCETLYTSLLVQAQRELTRAGSGDRAGGRRRSRSFRSSFLIAYANRVGERLAEVNDHVRHEVSGDAAIESRGPSVLPVLASRRSMVDDAVDARFGELSPGTVRGGHDWQGWSEGRLAADRAHLTSGDLPSKQAS